VQQRASATTDAARKAGDDLVKAAADRLQVTPRIKMYPLSCTCVTSNLTFVLGGGGWGGRRFVLLAHVDSHDVRKSRYEDGNINIRNWRLQSCK
jgi:hypothetical protein